MVVLLVKVVDATYFFFFSSRRRHTRCSRDWSSDVCSSDLVARAQETREDAYIVAGMKSDLRNLVTAEEAFFADYVKYTSRIGPGGLQFAGTRGNSSPVIRLTANGWGATIRNANSATICAIFIGSTPTPPATKEGEPQCQ